MGFELLKPWQNFRGTSNPCEQGIEKKIVEGLSQRASDALSFCPKQGVRATRADARHQLLLHLTMEGHKFTIKVS